MSGLASSPNSSAPVVNEKVLSTPIPAKLKPYSNLVVPETTIVKSPLFTNEPSATLPPFTVKFAAVNDIAPPLLPLVTVPSTVISPAFVISPALISIVFAALCTRSPTMFTSPAVISTAPAFAPVVKAAICSVFPTFIPDAPPFILKSPVVMDCAEISTPLSISLAPLIFNASASRIVKYPFASMDENVILILEFSVF